MMSIRHAILHAFDFDTGSMFLSDHELDMDEKLVKSYVRRHLRRCLVSEQNMHGEFSSGSGFAEEMRLYLASQTSFIELSKQIATFFWETLRTCDDLVQADLLVADFEQSGEKPTSDASDEELERAFDGKPERRFAIVLLPRSQTFMHSIEHPSGGAFNEIVRHDATLPNPSGKVDTYALVDCETLAIDFRDKARTIAEAEVWVIQNMLLQCSREPSSHEVIKTVERIVEQVAELGDGNVAEAVSRAKACVAHSAEVDERVMPEQIGRQVFADEPRLQEHYEEAAQEAQLPEEVYVRRAVARRLTKSHHIRTDTGIDVTYPSEYSSSPEHLMFQREEDGSISIIIRNVRSIENR
jgi:hypothetical protein